MSNETCAGILARHTRAWQGAVQHRFLEQCQAGTIQAQQFKQWLIQDGLFVRDFVRFHAALLEKAPTHHFDLLLGGLGALKDELLWFAALTKQRGLDLDAAAPHPTCQRYQQFMRSTAKQPYAVHAVAFWAIERSYQEGWRMHMPGMPQPYHKYAERWGSLHFGEYVEGLEQQADEVLRGASEAERQEAEALFVKVCEMEKDFWSMAFAADA